ncbi:related to multidrug resistant protein [Phialocephala subalpina]|uniref:Related to multidrug resistant protein n=1 Tax=Phialocephala subalpina TaxID=576137 RepID=A0A1L7WSU4_9HELO|nr:related to multidrug resistant protein [Phialocephala subalpina]
MILEVTWNGDADPKDPYNWPFGKRMAMTVLISAGGLVSTIGTSMMAPALPQISTDLALGASATQLALSIYLLAFVFGPFVIAPFSEMYGRKPAWLFCHSWFIFWNALCPLNKSSSILIMGRFLSGLGGSVGIALAAATTADLWRPSQRGMSLSIVTFAPFLGAAIGPTLGGSITQNIGWPWLFWTVSFFDLAILLLSLFLVHESYAPVLLSRKASSLRKATGHPYETKFERSNPTLRKKLLVSFTRPLKLMIRRPIIQFMSVLLAYNFGIYCLALATFANIFADKYHQSETARGLNYIAIALGSTIATQVGGPITDRVWAHLKRKAGGAVVPEYRVPLMIPGTILTPIGLFLYGWSAEKHLPWIVTDIGAAIFSGGVMMGSNAMYAYLIDEFAEHAASANAAARSWTNILGFAFPIFAPSLYQKFGYGWGNSLLGFIYIGMAIPAPLILWKYGARIRAVGRVQVKPVVCC